jgi:GNAT superfamily N-acetyltransferase
MDRRLFLQGRQVVDVEWVQREILCYSKSYAPKFDTTYYAELLASGDPAADVLLAQFDGGVYAVRDSSGGIAAHAGIKNKGVIREIAVGTAPQFQRRGMGKAVVAQAVAATIAQGNVPNIRAR